MLIGACICGFLFSLWRLASSQLTWRQDDESFWFILACLFGLLTILVVLDALFPSDVLGPVLSRFRT